MHARAPHLTYQPALDGLRALAVLAVIGYHFEPDWVPGGFLGVDTFFVLSGYLITSLLLAEWRGGAGIGLRAFWARRARRLLPALLVLLAGVSLAAAAWTPATLLGRLRGDGLAGLFYSANWRLVASGQSYFDLYATPSPLRHLWSLAIEEQFYVVWPLLVLGALLLARGSRRLLATICCAGIVASAVTMALEYRAADPSRAYYGTDGRVHVILVGALLALLLERRTIRVPAAAGWAAAAVAIAAWFTVGDRSGWLYHGGFLLYAVLTAVLVTSAWRPLSIRPLRWVGRISYGLYLWHWPVAVYLTARRTGVDGAALDALRVAVTFAIASASYYAIEQPIRHGALRGRFALGAAPAAVMATGAVVLAVTAAAAPLPAYYSTSSSVIVARAPLHIERPRIEPAVEAVAPAPAAVAPAASEYAPHRVLLVGDSVAYTLEGALGPELAARGASFRSAAIIGCGAVDAVVSDEQGHPYEWAESCRDAIAHTQQDALAALQPDLVVWLSTWETSPRLVDGKVVRLGTPDGDAAVRASIEAAADRLTAGGARLVFLVPAPTVAGDLQEGAVALGDEYSRLASVFRSIATARPDRIAVVDLTPIVCGHADPCPETRDGVRLRPVDGRHFTPETAPLVAGEIADAVVTVRWPNLPPAPGTPRPATRAR